MARRKFAISQIKVRAPLVDPDQDGHRHESKSDPCGGQWPQSRADRACAAGRRSAGRLPGRCLRSAGRCETGTRLGGGHLDWCDQLSDHCRQSSGSAHPEPAQVLGACFEPSHVSAAGTRRRIPQDLQRDECGHGRGHRCSRLLRTALSARVHDAAGVCRSNQHLRHRSSSRNVV